jgi:hypothetical protein
MTRARALFTLLAGGGLLLLSACYGVEQPGATQPPTAAATATLAPIPSRPPPTPTPTLPTATPLPTATHTPTPTPGGALTEDEQRRLYESALKYVAPTPAEAITVARSLHFLKDEGHPSNACGPLALAILRDAGLVDRSVILHDFWLLDPSEPSDVRMLEATFPRHRYLWYATPLSIATFDFHAFPLQAGDLLYLIAGPGGTYEHVIVVTRVDEAGRPFSVTNVNTEEGFIIEEVMLYDPLQPGAGQFHAWTDPANAHLGLTGQGGFLLWRRVKPLWEEHSEASDRLGAELDALLAGRGGHWNVVIKKVGGDPVYHRGAEELLTSNAMIDIPTAMLFFHALDRQGIDDYDAYLDANGVHGRTFRQLLEAMLVDGDPTATRHLAGWIGGQLDVEAVLQEWGLYRTTLAPGQTTALDAATILEGLVDGRLGTAGARALILEHLRARGFDRVVGGATLHALVDEAHALPGGSPGAGEVRRLASVEIEGEAAVLVICGSAPRYGEAEASLADLQQASDEIVLAFVNRYYTAG